MKKYSILVLIFLLSFLLSSCNNEEKKVVKYYSTGSVMTGTINTGESFVAYTSSFNTVNLAAKVGGKITSINYKEGDYVSAGTLVATLDGIESKTAYSSTDNILDTLLKLKISTSEMFDEQINAMKAKISQAEVVVSGANSGINDVNTIGEEQLKTVLTQKEELEKSIENTKQVLIQKESDLYVSAKNAIASSMIIDSNVVVFLDELFGVSPENKDENDDFEDYLSAKNKSLKTQAENSLRNILPKYNEYKLAYENKILNSQASNIEIEELLSLGLELNKSLRDLLKVSYDAVDASVVSTSFPQSTITNYKNSITSFRANVESAIMTVSGDYILGLEGSINNIANFKNESKATIDNLENKLATINQTYIQYEAQIKGQLTSVNTNKSLAEETLKEAKAGLESLIKQKETSLNEIDAKIKEAQANKNQAGVMIGNAQIYSPISGVIISKEAEVGQVIGAGNPILIVANPDNLKVEISVSEEVANSLIVGDEANIELEGFSNQIKGVVNKILPTKDTITKKVGVEIKIPEKNENIKIGTYTKVYFSKTGEEGLVIPNNAIVSKFMIPGVYVLEDGKAKFKNIEILSQNDNFSMINGLENEEIIIIEGKENIYDGEELK